MKKLRDSSILKCTVPLINQTACILEHPAAYRGEAEIPAPQSRSWSGIALSYLKREERTESGVSRIVGCSLRKQSSVLGSHFE